MVEIERVGAIKHLWGESLRWDDRRGRLYFVDAAALALHWLEDGAVEPRAMDMPSLPTGLVLTESGRVVVILEDGVYLADVDTGSLEKFADNPGPPPEPRLNDAQADRAGNLVTGSLAFTHNPVGAFWWLSSKGEWALLDRGISDANGPAFPPDGHTLLVVDTGEKAVFRYAYDAERGSVGPRTILIDTSEVAGVHDGATLDTEGRYWSAMTGGSQIISVASDGTIDRRIELPVDYPTALAFGGAHRDRLYVTSVSIEFGPVKPVAPDAGALLEITGLGVTGALEPRFAI
jgi:sugar lactone lactonase YvrE